MANQSVLVKRYEVIDDGRPLSRRVINQVGKVVMIEIAV
jgi:hypothetical protein